jgi:hypothetical protein
MEADMSDKPLWQCSVYAISDGHGNMKFGVAKDIQKRMRMLQTGNAHPLQLLFEVQCFCHIALEAAWGAHQVETDIHKRLKERRMTGEWFAVDYEDALQAMTESSVHCSLFSRIKRLQIEIDDVIVHVREHEHCWYWPTSDVYQRGLVQ